ncbi:helix-turn-helix domain-containing protein [Flavobacterium sp. NRK1]|uniref:helix-turn-helix domain-containing protein n=1 Tax=Flavobacterium sp. NRK1 TaxID=2954929 RepID=UPI0020930768|nr:helix-turn-helix domain-containing protein [Flavobacterium sp. NRK1]MCO6148270.1 helix-turn-helix domain-containing protein [Flavobacterium sp. NRK1]
MFAQKLPDSLKNKSYKYLNGKVDFYETKNPEKSWMYLSACLKKAKLENNHEEINYTYENMVYLSKPEQNIIYADSMIIHGRDIHNEEYITTGYIAKGSVYYSKKKYQKALDNYIIANEHAENTHNESLKYIIKYHISTIKFYLGFYEEIIPSLKESAKYFKTNDIKGYINCLHALSLCYNKTGKYDLCTKTNDEGLKASEQTNDIDKNYFIHSEGINQYSLNNYKTSIEKLKASTPILAKAGDFANETVGYFYLGKSYLALNDTDEALNYFRKVDRAFVEKNYIRPDLRENYEILINYYKKEHNTKMQLHYVEKLLKADSLLTRNFKYISGKVHKEYDSHKLELAREQLKKELDEQENTNYILFISLGILFLITLYLLYRYYTNQRNYRIKFDELMLTNSVSNNETVIIHEEKEEPKQLDINQEVVNAILKQLEKFEANNKFLQKDLTLVNLAVSFNTNTNYLSKIINYYRNKNYINYLNDLRIDYIVDLLKKDNKFRNYTIKALAEEAGFNTAQHFSKAFFARTGIYPSYFVTELNREQE